MRFDDFRRQEIAFRLFPDRLQDGNSSEVLFPGCETDSHVGERYNCYGSSGAGGRLENRSDPVKRLVRGL